MMKSTLTDGDRDFAGHDRQRVRHHAHPPVEYRLASGDAVPPRMAGIALDAAFQAVLKLVHIRRQGGANHTPQAHTRGLVRARVLERVELTPQVEDAYLAPLDADDLAAARRNVVRAGDDVCSHPSLAAS